MRKGASELVVEDVSLVAASGPKTTFLLLPHYIMTSTGSGRGCCQDAESSTARHRREGVGKPGSGGGLRERRGEMAGADSVR
jgi:hypothetical protein